MRFHVNKLDSPLNWGIFDTWSDQFIGYFDELTDACSYADQINLDESVTLK